MLLQGKGPLWREVSLGQPSSTTLDPNLVWMSVCDGVCQGQDHRGRRCVCVCDRGRESLGRVSSLGDGRVVGRSMYV